MKRYLPKSVLVLILIVTSLLPACGSKSSILITAAYDLQSPIERKVLPDYINRNISFDETKITYSSDPIQSLKNGDCNMVILGREPLPGELDGLEDTVVAYDAVCILIDYNSWAGGEYWTNTPYIDTIQPAAEILPVWGWNPVSKMAGINNLTINDLKGIFNYNVKVATEKWTYNQFYSWDSLVDFNTGQKSFFKQWILTPKQITPSLQLKPGIFDTQTVLYNDLGLTQQNVTGTSKSEEASLDTLYKSSAGIIGQETFSPLISFASRMVTQVALTHVGVAVVTINGINPVTDIDAVYNGTYPLTRKIHLITRKYVSPSIQAFKDYLLSADGQNVLANAGLLPLQEPTGSTSNLASSGTK